MRVKQNGKFVSGCMLGLVALMVVPVMAQDRGGRRGFRGFGRGGATSLLRREAVRKELKLTSEQQSKIEDLMESERDNRREFFQSLRDLSPEERIKQTAANRDKMDATLGKILKAEQSERLFQIEIQQSGPAVLGRMRCAKALKLTDEQKAKLMKMQIAGQRIQREAMREARDSGDRQAAFAKLRELREQQNKKLLAVLTDAQREQFKKMAGEKLDLPRRQGGRRGGGQRA